MICGWAFLYPFLWWLQSCLCGKRSECIKDVLGIRRANGPSAVVSTLWKGQAFSHWSWTLHVVWLCLPPGGAAVIILLGSHSGFSAIWLFWESHWYDKFTPCSLLCSNDLVMHMIYQQCACMYVYALLGICHFCFSCVAICPWTVTAQLCISEHRVMENVVLSICS